MLIRSLNIIFVAVLTFLYTLSANAENPTDSLSAADNNLGTETTHLPLILVSMGDVNTFKSKIDLGFEENFSVKIYKYFYVGITYKIYANNEWRTDRYIGSIQSSSLEFIIEALSNPIFKRNKFSIYNPQNEMFAPRKTKRSLLKNETLLKPPFFKKIFDPASPGIGVAPAQYLNGLRT